MANAYLIYGRAGFEKEAAAELQHFANLYQLAFKQLYHDREEVTGYLYRC